MKNTFGNSFAVTLFGESHGPYIGVVCDGFAPGLRVDTDKIDSELLRRRPKGKISTQRVEKDQYEIISGVYKGRTTGTPLTIIIPNSATKSADYEDMAFIPRPGHADLAAGYKYHGFEDRRGGGHFSGRITAALVAAGAVCQTALEAKKIRIGTHILSVGSVSDRAFKNVDEDLDILKNAAFPVLLEGKEAEMTSLIEQYAENKDSIGGVLETAVSGVIPGLGEPWFDSMESVLSHAMFSIPAIKGVSFGLGFEGTGLSGSIYNDPIRVKDGMAMPVTNNNGGINGGITNGMPVIMKLAVKPTPSIFKKQDSVNMQDMTDTELTIQGRHDPAIIHRAACVVDAMTAIVMYDVLTGRYGCDWFTS
ncbi:MAG: chorismate synthase [Lachnospiraceae bacterium]|nr:chorismate synthase [Lachnospiraceae bacterium]